MVPFVDQDEVEEVTWWRNYALVVRADVVDVADNSVGLVGIAPCLLISVTADDLYFGLTQVRGEGVRPL